VLYPLSYRGECRFYSQILVVFATRVIGCFSVLAELTTVLTTFASAARIIKQWRAAAANGCPACNTLISARCYMTHSTLSPDSGQRLRQLAFNEHLQGMMQEIAG